MDRIVPDQNNLLIFESTENSEKDKTYQCHFADCSEVFYSDDQLRKHLFKHILEREIKLENTTTNTIQPNEPSNVKTEENIIYFEFKCSESSCFECFSTKAKLDKHMFNIHQIGFKCACDELFTDKMSLVNHALSCEQGSLNKPIKKQEKKIENIIVKCFQCKKCSHIVLCKRQLSKHSTECHLESLNHNQTLQNLDTNKEEFYFKINLYEIFENGFRCCTCSRIMTKHKFFMIKHAVNCKLSQSKPREKEADIRLVCAICKKIYNNRPYYRQHLKTHIPEYVSKLKCPKCPFISEHPLPLKLHISHKHDNRERIICHICGKLVLNYLLIGHLETHNSDMNHQCDKCEKKFSQRLKLMKHMLVHTQKKAYLCDMCGKGFGLRHNMVAHKRIHTGERPFTCEICQKGFISNALRRSHVCKGYTE